MSDRYGLSLASILHPTDFSEGSEVAFAHALRLACETQGHLSILHVDRRRGPPDWDRYPSVRDTLAKWNLLPRGASRSDVANLGVQISKSSVTAADPAAGVLEFLNHHPADLLVMSTHQRHGLDRWLHDTVAGKIARRSDGASLFIPAGSKGFVDAETGVCSLHRVLCPIDHTPDPLAAIETVSDLVRSLHPGSCRVQLLHTGEPASAPKVQLARHESILYHWTYASGQPAAAILDEARAQSCDLIAMTTAGRHGFWDALRGSTTEQVLENAPCPVLAVHEWVD
jgi:nucleotide-binding universal stress UspA family protein